MKMFNVKKIVGAVVACGLAIATTASPAQAAFVLSLTDGTNSVTIVDQGVGDLDPGTVNHVLWTGNIGVFTINTDSGLTTANATTAEMDLDFSGTATGAGTLTMTLYNTGFTAGTLPPLPGTLSSAIGGTLHENQTIVAQSWKDPNNGIVGGTGITAGPIPVSYYPAGPFVLFIGSNHINHAALVSPYSMISQVQLISTGNTGFFSGNMDVINSTVPEPGSMMLLGSGLLFLAKTARRRFGKKA